MRPEPFTDESNQLSAADKFDYYMLFDKPGESYAENAEFA
jgi:hypothetical protein